MIELSISDTAIGLAPLVFGVLIYRNMLNKQWGLVVASSRMVLQLIAIGFTLSFLFGYSVPWLGLLVILLMVIAAAIIAIRPLQIKSTKHLAAALAALAIAGTLNLGWIVIAVLKLDPWYQPQIVIPLAGMVFANGMNALSIAAERFESERKTECQESAIGIAFNAAMIPQINALLAVGLVSLPGMMTGQILSGVSPLVAVRYQILIMSMITAVSIIAIWLYFKLLNLLNPETLKEPLDQ